MPASHKQGYYRAVEPTGPTSSGVALPRRDSRWWRFNIGMLAVTFLVTYQLFPHFAQQAIFVGILRNGWYVLPALALATYSYRYFRRNQGDFLGLKLGNHRRPIAVVAFATVVWVLACMTIYASTDYVAYRIFAKTFTSRESLVPTAPSFVRFTPLGNACNDIGNSISTTGEHVECKYVAPIITGSGFGYAAPIMPSGVFNTFIMNNPGFMLLDDSAKVSDDPAKRLARIDDVQAYGPGMEWFDNLDYVLAKTDFFATFDKPHYLALDPAQPKKLTLVVPKIKYAYLWRLPYWGGVVLVHSDGKIEDLTAEAATKDARLKGKWIYPLWLAKYYIELQNYGTGWGIATPYVTIPGKLEVEKLDGGNQFPFLTQGTDGHTYLVTATKGQGSARGLLRMYFTEASTGAGTYHEFGNHEVVYGAGAAKDRLTNIPNYQWYHSNDKGGSGSIIATEPVYVVRPNDSKLYWKFTITNRNYSGISATAVANAARPDDILVFTKRSQFEEWLHGNDSVAVVAKGSDVIGRDKILRMIEDLARLMEELKREAGKLP